MNSPVNSVFLFVGAFLIRLLFVLRTSRGLGELLGDASEYHEYGLNLFRKGIFVATNGFRAWRTPGYPFFYGLISALTHDSVFAVQVVQCLVSALTCVLLFHCALAFLSDRKWSLITAWMAVFYYDLYAGTPRLLSEVLYAFTIVLFFYLVLTRSRSLKEVFMLGAFAGLCGLVRPEFLLFGFVYSFFLMSGPEGKPFSRVLCYGLGGALTYGPWILRNYFIFHRFVPTALHSTENTYVGLYQPLSDLGFLPYLQYQPTGMSEMAIYDHYRVLVGQIYHQLPLHTILCAYLHNFVVFFYPFLPSYDMTFVILLPFWLLGGFLAIRSRDRRALLILTYIVITVIIYTVINGSAGPRFRQPLSPAYLLLAGYGLKFLFEEWRAKSLPVILTSWLIVNGGIKVAQSQVRLFYKASGKSLLTKMIASSHDPLGGKSVP